MTDHDEQPPVYVEDCYRWLGRMIGRFIGFLFICALAGYTWGSLV